MTKELHNNVCNESIFENVYKKHAQNLHDFIYYKYGEHSQPHDKAQDAFIKLWDNCKDVSLSKAKSFLFTVANNMVLNDLKHQKVVLKHQQVKPKHYTNESPEFIMESEQFLLKYETALAKLSEEQRVAFLLNKVEGKKHSEIAEQLGLTKKVVEYRIYTAFKKIKEELNVDSI